jgi:hypothetical protein
MDPLANTKVVIVVFAMHGCPACQDYLPRLYRQVEGYQKMGHPLVIYQGETLAKGQIPVMVYDSTSQAPDLQNFANLHKIENLPTTLLLPKIGGSERREGALTDQEIYTLLNTAIAINH